MKYNIDYTNVFKKQYKKMIKQGKDINKLINNNYFDNCYECHIEPDWLLVYKIDNSELFK